MINIETGEKLDIDCSDEQLSDALRAVRVKIKALEKIDTELTQRTLDRIKTGDKTFGDFWQVVEAKRKVIEYPNKKIEKEVKGLIDKIQEPYRKNLFFKYLKFPKF